MSVVVDFILRLRCLKFHEKKPLNNDEQNTIWQNLSALDTSQYYCLILIQLNCLLSILNLMTSRLE